MSTQGKLAGGLFALLAVASLLLASTRSTTQTATSTAREFRPGTAKAEEPRGTPAGRHSSLADLYRAWEAAHLERGGDRALTLRLGRSRSLGHHIPATGGAARAEARGTVHLDLLGGSLRAEVSGLTEAADLWLVDNRSGPGHSALPEPGDRMLRVGPLVTASGTARLERSLGPGLFDRFEVDWVVVTRAGRRPSDRSLLYAGRSYFERLYTRLGRAGEGARASLLAPLAPRGLIGPPSRGPDPATAPQALATSGLISRQVADGADLFFRETFDGNGRTCGTCHRASANLTIDADLIASLPADDPLFVAERPASAGGVPGLEAPELLRRFELILENIDGFEDPERKLTLRGIPHIQSLRVSIAPPLDDGRPPLERTGWSGDGAPMSGELRLFALGAVHQHFPRTLDRIPDQDFRFPTSDELDALEAYMLSVGRMIDTRITGMIFEDSRAALGRETFLGRGKCFTCHVNLGAINGFGGNRNFETGIEQLAHPARAVRDFPPDGGFGTEPRDLDGDGAPDVFGDGTFNTPPLVEAADTGPFFHNNQFASLEDAVAFYDGEEFNASPGGEFVDGIELTEEEIDAVVAFLRVVNAAYNIELALQRMTAVRSLGPGQIVPVRAGGSAGPPPSHGSHTVRRTLIRLANLEIADAAEVLTAGELHAVLVERLLEALTLNEQALAARTPRRHRSLLDRAAAALQEAREGMGHGLVFLLGEGNLAF